MTMTTREVLETAAAYIKEAINQLPADQPEVPDRVEVWPENDEHLRGDCWKSPWGSIISYRDDKWRWWNSRDRTWHLEATPGFWSPLERIADPSLPRRFDSLADIPENVERAVGKYVGHPCELARSSPSGTGWMMRVDAPGVRYQWAEYMGLNTVTDIEEVIDHE